MRSRGGVDPDDASRRRRGVRVHVGWRHHHESRHRSFAAEPFFNAAGGGGDRGGTARVGTGDGAAGKRRAMKQEGSGTGAGRGGRFADLAAIAKSSEGAAGAGCRTRRRGRPRLGERTARSSAAKGSRSKPNGIYAEEPVVLEDPAFADAGALTPRAAKGTKVARNAAPEPATVENQNSGAAVVHGVSQRGRGSGERAGADHAGGGRGGRLTAGPWRTPGRRAPRGAGGGTGRRCERRR